MITKPWKCYIIFIAFGTLMLTGSNYAQGALSVYYNETDFLSAAGPVTMESFETIPIVNQVEHTNLASPIPALNPGNPNFDLDGHFDLWAFKLAAIGQNAWEFLVIDDGSPTDQVDGINFLSYEPYWGNLPCAGTGELWCYPQIKFKNFNNTNASVYAFGLYFLEGGASHVDFGDQRIIPEFSGAGPHFIGLISDSPAGEIIFYVDGGAIDEIYYGTTSPLAGMDYSTSVATPIPPAVWLFGSGLLGLGILGWRKKGG